MGLWIRTQERDSLLEVSNVNLGCNENGEPTRIFAFANVNSSLTSFTLGDYKTEERALEILDEIESILAPRLIIKGTTPTNDFKIRDERIFYTSEKYVEVTQLPIRVYRMPKA